MHGRCRGLAQRSRDLLVLPVPDQDDGVPQTRKLHRLQVHFGHQGAGGIDDLQIPILGNLADGRGHPVSAEDDPRALGHFVNLVDANRTRVAATPPPRIGYGQFPSARR